MTLNIGTDHFAERRFKYCPVFLVGSMEETASKSFTSMYSAVRPQNSVGLSAKH